MRLLLRHGGQQLPEVRLLLLLAAAGGGDYSPAPGEAQTQLKPEHRMASYTVWPDVTLATPPVTSGDVTLATAQVTSGAAAGDATDDVTLATAPGTR